MDNTTCGIISRRKEIWTYTRTYSRSGKLDGLRTMNNTQSLFEVPDTSSGYISESINWHLPKYHLTKNLKKSLSKSSKVIFLTYN